MVIARYRRRDSRMEGIPPDGSGWDTPVFLGHWRDLVTGTQGGVPFEYWGDPYSPQSYAPDVSTTAYEATWDENHGRPKGANMRGRFKTTAEHKRFYDTGGPFLNIKIATGLPSRGTVSGGSHINKSGTKKYEGNFCLPRHSFWLSGWASSPGAFLTNDNSLLPDVAPYFDRAWRKAKPKIETAGLFVALRELRELPLMLSTTAKLMALEYNKGLRYVTRNTEYGPKLVSESVWISSRNMRPRELADQFLNHQFGWVPFLNDLDNFYKTWVNADDQIRTLTRQNGQWKRKSAKVHKEVDTQILQEVTLPLSTDSYAIPCFPVSFPADFFQMPPSWKVVEETTTTINASGKFRFYHPAFDITLPDYTSAWKQVMRYRKIYGLTISPYHVWQSTPWTWLVDWVSNLGAFVERMSDTLEDQVAAAYFYITSRRTVRRRLEINLPWHDGLQTLSFERSYRSKQRVSADSPYGFSLSWDALTPRRLAILGALGITRRSSNFRFGD